MWSITRKCKTAGNPWVFGFSRKKENHFSRLGARVINSKALGGQADGRNEWGGEEQGPTEEPVSDTTQVPLPKPWQSFSTKTCGLSCLDFSIFKERPDSFFFLSFLLGNLFIFKCWTPAQLIKNKNSDKVLGTQNILAKAHVCPVRWTSFRQTVPFQRLP